MIRTAVQGMVATLFVAIPSVASAHPGHGSTDPSSILHFIVEPEHALLLVPLATIALAGLIAGGLRRTRARR